MHRDLKPGNIFLCKSGLLKLGDFGLSTVLNNTQSKVEGMLGTPYYIAPEMLLGEKHNFASDIWSLGVILFEMTTLKPPFMGKTYASLAMKIVNCDKNY